MVLRVAYVFPGGAEGMGGAESQALEFFRRYDRRRLGVALVLLGPHADFERLSRQVPDLIVVPLNPAGMQIWSPRLMFQYHRWLARWRPGVVHLYGLRHEVWTRCLSRLAGAAVISAIRGMESHRHALAVWLNRMTARCVHLWVANSAAVKELFVKRDRLPGERIIVVPNGVDVGEDTPSPSARRAMRGQLCLGPECYCVGCIANHHAAKRIGDLIEALAGLDPEDVPWELVLLGRETAHTSELRTLAEKLQVSRRVHVLGFRPDARDLLPALDVAALPSEKEGMPASLLEAMAAGLPVVASRVGGTAELVVDGETGILVPVGDLASLRLALAGLADDPKQARMMGERGRERAREFFDIRQTTRIIETVYESVAVGWGRRGDWHQ